MNVTPVSGDFLLKAGLVLGGVGLLAWLLWRKRNLVNPMSPENLAYTGVNAAGGAIFTDPEAAGKNADGSWSLGGALFDLFNPGTAAAVKAMSGPAGTDPGPIIDYSQSGAF